MSIIGKTVQQVRMNPARTYLVFDCTDGSKECFYTSGDCCSRSWIEHTTNVDWIKGRKIVGYTTADLRSFTASEKEPGTWMHPAKDTYDDHIQVYSASFAFEDGNAFTVEFRNQSNGYYGGELESVAEDDVPWNEMGVVSEDF
jgi:hypothetical protein